MNNKKEIFEYGIKLFRQLNEESDNVTALIIGDYRIFNAKDLYFLDFDIKFKCGYTENITHRCKDLNLLIELAENLSKKLNIPVKREYLN